MRHGNGLRKLNRTSSHRLAMLRNMCNSLIQHEAIKATVRAFDLTTCKELASKAVSCSSPNEVRALVPMDES